MVGHMGFGGFGMRGLYMVGNGAGALREGGYGLRCFAGGRIICIIKRRGASARVCGKGYRADGAL